MRIILPTEFQNMISNVKDACWDWPAHFCGFGGTDLKRHNGVMHLRCTFDSTEINSFAKCDATGPI